VCEDGDGGGWGRGRISGWLSWGGVGGFHRWMGLVEKWGDSIRGVLCHFSLHNITSLSTALIQTTTKSMIASQPPLIMSFSPVSLSAVLLCSLLHALLPLSALAFLLLLSNADLELTKGGSQAWTCMMW